MSQIFPVLLAGGSGTRLWPLSRKSYPKQFSKLMGQTTLFQSSAERLTSSALIDFSPHITLTNTDYRFIIGEQLQEVGIDPGAILIEPEAKNTASSILAASLFAHSRDPEAILLVAPSDHVIPDKRYFHEMVRVGLSHVEKGNFVTFGIEPTHPETGYGYLELSESTLDSFGTSELLHFVEKPDLKRATEMMTVGNFLWNAGIFLFRAADMMAAFDDYSPKTLDLVSQAMDLASADLGFLRLASEPWSMLENISIDYAIMEKANNLVVVPYSSKWSDLGGWDAVWSEDSKDQFGNTLSESSLVLDCTNCLLRSDSDKQQLVGIGLDSIVAVAMADAVLIARKDRVQDVKVAVDMLKSKDIAQAEIFPKDYRPWGWFESLVEGECFQVKRIFVKPKSSFSLQSHKQRSEHWVVVEGVAKVTIDDKIKTIEQGQSTFIPLGAKHRIENPSDLPMILIEVQIGSYFGEDDIVRYED